jgi:hypothetical protein
VAAARPVRVEIAQQRAQRDATGGRVVRLAAVPAAAARLRGAVEGIGPVGVLLTGVARRRVRRAAESGLVRRLVQAPPSPASWFAGRLPEVAATAGREGVRPCCIGTDIGSPWRGRTVQPAGSGLPRLPHPPPAGIGQTRVGARIPAAAFQARTAPDLLPRLWLAPPTRRRHPGVRDRPARTSARVPRVHTRKRGPAERIGWPCPTVQLRAGTEPDLLPRLRRAPSTAWTSPWIP